jgi:hypothetical protein
MFDDNGMKRDELATLEELRRDDTWWTTQKTKRTIPFDTAEGPQRLAPIDANSDARRGNTVCHAWQELAHSPDEMRHCEHQSE